MRIPSLLVTLLVVAAGCDSVEEATSAGPTVQFGASSLNVSEGDGTVQIPVVLTGGEPGQSYTVQVLFATSASSAASNDSLFFGRDIDNFGEADGANRVATVTLTGPEDTQTVSIDVIDDSQPEGPEVAVFVLQRVSEGATIGPQREFRLEIGTPPIADIRTRDIGTVVTVEGIVTRARGRFSYLQDDSGTAIATFASGDDYAAAIASGAVRQGDRVQIVGELTTFNDLLQVSNITDFEVLSRDNDLPAVQTLTLAQLINGGDEFESELVRITGLMLTTGDVVFSGNTSYDVTDGNTTATLRTSRDTDSGIVGMAIQPITDGSPGSYGPFTFVGTVGQFRGTNQLAPVNPDDLRAQ